MNEVPVLGKLCDENARRDAVHVAIAPVIAGEELWAGNRVRFVKDGTLVRSDIVDEHEGKTVGIVDPFLKGPVLKGKRFWLCLLPGTTHSLRHSWSHPAFRAKSLEELGRE